MNRNAHMTISEFAHYTGIKRANLIFYDKIGLITPELRGENGYRYYTQRQISTAFLVSSLRELGIGIQTIKEYTDRRTPETMIALFEQQQRKIDRDIQALFRLKGIMGLYTDSAAAALREDTTALAVKQMPREPVFFSSRLEETERDTDEALNAFYEEAEEQGVSLSYPLGIAFSRKSLLSGMLQSPERFYLKVSQSHKQFKPAGPYATGYSQGLLDEAQTIRMLYDRLMDFIGREGLTIYGGAYVEYPLSEIALREEKDYLIRMQILVE